MIRSESQLFETNQLAAECSVPAVRAYGDGDDPLRLTVLLADLLGSEGPEDLVAACKDRRATWRARRSALRDLLRWARDHRRSADAPYYMAFIDPDALSPSADTDWEDAPARAMRGQLLDTLRDAVLDGGWVVIRPWPTATVSEKLAGEPAPSGASVSGSTAVPDFFMPDCRPTVRWLIERRTLTDGDAMRLVTSVRDPNEHVLRIGYDVLGADARAAARRLSAYRAPSHANGSFGDLSWGAETVSPTDFRLLRDAGFLQADDAHAGNDYRLTRRARAMLSLHANAMDSAHVRRVHELLAKIPDFGAQPAERQLEAHYHAVQAGDVALAKETALFYGTELSHVATQLSRSGDPGAFSKAADLFGFILDNYDPDDAYAREYRAYNLARADREAGTPGKHEEEIRRRYREAHSLSPGNPLYHGRWIGYRAERGDEVVGEIERGLSHYLDRVDERGDEKIASQFAFAALDGLGRGGAGQRAALKAVVKRWRPRLELLAPRVLDKYTN